MRQAIWMWHMGCGKAETRWARAGRRLREDHLHVTALAADRGREAPHGLQASRET